MHTPGIQLNEDGLNINITECDSMEFWRKNKNSYVIVPMLHTDSKDMLRAIFLQHFPNKIEQWAVLNVRVHFEINTAPGNVYNLIFDVSEYKLIDSVTRLVTNQYTFEIIMRGALVIRANVS
ncbi:hypothetical protein [Microcystis phage Mel-JY01]